MVQSHTWQEYAQEDQGTCKKKKKKKHTNCDRYEILASNSVGKKQNATLFHTHNYIKSRTLCNEK